LLSTVEASKGRFNDLRFIRIIRIIRRCDDADAADEASKTGLRPHTRFASLRGTKQSRHSILGLDCFVVPPRNDAKRQNGRRNTSPRLTLTNLGRQKHEALCSSGFMAFFSINDSAKIEKSNAFFKKDKKNLTGRMDYWAVHKGCCFSSRLP